MPCSWALHVPVIWEPRGLSLSKGVSEHPLQSKGSGVCSWAAFLAGKASPCHTVLLWSPGPLPCCWQWRYMGNNVWFISSLALSNLILQGRCTLSDSLPQGHPDPRDYFSISPVGGNSSSLVFAITHRHSTLILPSPRDVGPMLEPEYKNGSSFPSKQD